METNEPDHMGDVDQHPDAHRATEDDEERVLHELYGPADPNGFYTGEPGR
ncbi:hypothetical protein [Actinomadura litoris]|nr:hypothetical protein [Actinomadura litoris]